ncbi:ribokinase [Leifsonia xyli subsp. xyli]|uniref:Tagatose 6-phosphate kinase n=2 Tax=Leifsonia xyli subsp. xyli TaxID=59736 RepID=Q6AD91_LEIXX|nr:PfkB family carbohydrate kinase [Leifsonia xyli]AAT89653.1 tagatose 6-phosphate kinase [Leifsonia xyli subsp. xyli str. CTCB07]ODA91241.1 ribokinase [Leifsonia xyli subsp. xyli]
MILTVTPNPAIDLTYRVPALEAGETHRVAPPTARAGGKGLNVARVIAQTGVAAFALTTAGGASGLRLAGDLEASGIPSELVPVAAPTRATVAILAETGGALSAAEWNALRESANRLAGPATALVGSGSLPPDAPDDIYAELVAIALAHRIPSVIDADGRSLLAAAEAGASVLKPNRRELAGAAGTDDPVAGARLLLDAGAGLVLVSLGGDGMLAVRPGAEPAGVRLPEPLSGNATGAGDAAVAAVATALAAGEDDPLVLLRRAAAWSAAVLAPLAGELDPAYAEFEARLVPA